MKINNKIKKEMITSGVDLVKFFKLMIMILVGSVVAIPIAYLVMNLVVPFIVVGLIVFGIVKKNMYPSQNKRRK